MIKRLKEKLNKIKEKIASRKVEKMKKQQEKEMKEEKLRKELEKQEKEVVVPLKETEEEENPEALKELEEQEHKKGLIGQLEDLNEKMDIISQKKKQVKKLKKKSFKLPFKVKGQLKKLALKNKVQVMLLQRTRNIMPVIGEIRDGMLMVGDNIFEGAVKYTWLWRGKYPTFIVPEWDLSPISKEGVDNMRGRPLDAGELYQDTKDNQRSSEPQKIILRAIEAKENLMLKGKTPMKAIVITVVVVIVLMAILMSGGAI